ncbi:MAG: serine hydroxymethyltransferase, partial [Burkholderiales bacterium]
MTQLLRQPLRTVDPEVAALIVQETRRQSDRLELVASENHISLAQREASGSVLADTTVEGYPGARFLAASAGVDALEQLAVDRACRLFGARFANVQPHSGTQANQAALLALLRPGDTLLSMDVRVGGHFSHGAAGTVSGDWFTPCHYGVDPRTGLIDPDEVLALARRHRPR